MVRSKQVQSEAKLISTRHGDDGPWSSFLIHVGSPGQDVNVLPDPYRSALVVVDPEGCPSDPRLADCVRNRGGTYKRGDSDTWNRSSRHAWNPSELHPPSAWTSWTSSNKTSHGDPLAQHPEGTSRTNKVGIDRVRGEADGRPWMVPEQGILSTSDLNPFVGIFGLATNAGYKARAMVPTSLFDNIRRQANQRSISWSYTAGRVNEIPGSLVLGGYDVSRFNHSTTVTTVGHGMNWNLMTGLDGITINDPAQPAKLLNLHLPVDLDFSRPYLELPSEACRQFENAFGLKWSEDDGLYTVDDVKHNEFVARNVSLSFTIQGDSGKQDFVVPYKSLVLTATFPKVAQNMRYFALQRSPMPLRGSLGRAFLQETYITAVLQDAPRGMYFNLSQARYSPNTPSHIVEIVSAKRTGKYLSGAWIAISVIGVAAVVTLLLLVWAKVAKRGPFGKKKTPTNEEIEFDSRVNLRTEVAPGASAAERNVHGDAASTKGSIYYEAVSEIERGEGSKEGEPREMDIRPEPEKMKHY
jgi:hypothetical protein